MKYLAVLLDVFNSFENHLVHNQYFSYLDILRYLHEIMGKITKL